MAHSNSTTNYNLPQFVSTDKPAWLTDVNTAYSDIDTGIHNAQVAADDAQADATQALTDASAAATTASAADSKATGAVASIAENFSDTSTYIVDDLVMYNSILYKCIVPVSNPGPWTGTANWARYTIDEIATAVKANAASISNINADISSINDDITDIRGDMISITPVSLALAFQGTKTVYTDINLSIGRIIPQSAVLSADAGVPLIVTLQVIGPTTTRLRVTALQNYTSNISVNYLRIN